MSKTNDRHRGTPAVTPLPADLEALFAGAPKLSHADLAQLEKAASKLEKDPTFIADLAKGLIIEDILRAMEHEGINGATLAGRIGKTRQYVSKVLDEDRRVNFTVETLAEFSAALNLQLCLRMVPDSEHMLFIRRLSAPVTLTSADQFPDEESEESITPDVDLFEYQNTISYSNDDTYEPTSLRA